METAAADHGIGGRRAGWTGVTGAGLEAGDPLPQHGDEIAHDVHERLFDPEEVSIEVALRHTVADLPRQAGVQLVFGHRLEHLAALVGLRVLGIVRHVDRLGGDGDLVDLLPRPFEVRAARRDDADLREAIPLPLLRSQVLRDGIIQRGLALDPLGAAEARLHRPFVLIDREESGQQVAAEEPRNETNNTAKQDRHKRWVD